MGFVEARVVVVAIVIAIALVVAATALAREAMRAGGHAAAADGTAEPSAMFGQQATAVGYGGAVASDSLPATRAGIRVLGEGGNAVDAAVAVAATLGVSDPMVAGIGGGGYFVYYDAHTHQIYTLDGRETAPAADNPNLFIDPATGKPLTFATAVTSGLSVGVPGTLSTWDTALKLWGERSMMADLRPAIRVAEHGFPVTDALHEEIRENAGRFDQFSSTSQLLLPGGQPPATGSILRNPDLARTYRLIGDQGPDALYGGEVGQDVVNAVHNLPLAPGATLLPRPGAMTLADLADYNVKAVAPTHVNYRGYDVYGMAPSSSGGITVGETLNILANFDMAHLSGVQFWQHFLEATRLAYADRNHYIGDPAYVSVPQDGLLSPAFGQQRACQINPLQAATSPVAPGDPSLGSGGCLVHGTPGTDAPDNEFHTNHLVVTDAQGDVVSYTNTIEELGGSGVVVPGRGFLLNNELTDFNFSPSFPGDPNTPAAGKRPRSSMSPTIVLHDARPFLAVGAAGGASIITTVLQILLERIDLHMSLPDAIDAPRASQRNSTTTQAEPAFLTGPYAMGLEQLGQTFKVVDTNPLDPTVSMPPTIGTAAGLEFLGEGRVLAAGEATRRGGGAAAVVIPFDAGSPDRPSASRHRP